MAQLRKVIKDAINDQGKFIVEKVWRVEIDEPHFLDGIQEINICLTVRPRKRKKPEKYKFRAGT